MTSPTEPVTPRFLCVFVRRFYRFVVTSHSKVLVVAAQFGTERSVLFPYGIMPIFLTPVPRHFQITVESLTCGLFLDDWVASEASAPVV